ncbi:MAG: methyl-accepting chemotaxis protein [Chloroflexi bacterium]|nr:methyl-accepting chemotaxis protein [Chloroflexota bacterium]
MSEVFENKCGEGEGHHVVDINKLRSFFRLRRLTDLKVGTKLVGGFAITIIILLIVAVVGYFNMKSINDNMNVMYNDRLVPVQLCGNLSTYIYQVRADTYRFVAVPAERQKSESDINVSDKAGKIDKIIAALHATNMTDAEKKQLADLDKAWLEFNNLSCEVFTQIKIGNDEMALSNLADAATSCSAMDKATAGLSEEFRKNAEAMYNQGKANFQSNVIMTAALSFVAVVLSILLAIILTRSITGPLSRGVGMMRELALGHLGKRLKMKQGDEIGVLAESMDKFADDLQYNVVGTMKKISAGDLTVDVTLKDEADEIGPALKNTIDSLRGLTENMNKVYREQKAGDIEYYLDTSGLQGVFKDVAEGYNAAIKMHVDNTLKILGILNSYAEGDFTAVLEKLPGKQVIANEKMDLLRNNLISLIVETEMLTAGAAEGKLDVRGDISRYKGDYLRILQGINNTLDNIVEPLNESLEVLAKEAENDLTKHVTGEYHGDLNKLKNAINASTDTRINVVLKLRQVTNNLIGSSDQLSRATEQASQATQQIAASSQQVAKGAADQAGALQDTMKAIGQLASAIDQIAKGAQEQAQIIEKNVQVVTKVSSAIAQVSANAQNASAGARVAAESAQKGAKISRETVKGMESIKKTMDAVSARINGLGDRSKEIGKIVAAIDDIADQTNLLALNAAIEAARAGEQGRGFAVVADEVRKLAERSSKATEEIADLINGIQSGVAETVTAMQKGTKEVDGGFDLVNKAGESLDEILARSKEVGIQVEQISSAAQQLTDMSIEMVKLSDNINAIVEENTASTQQMAATAKQVSLSVENVAGVAEENSAATEQVSAAAEEISAQMQQVVDSGAVLNAMSDDFKQLVDGYKLNGNGHGKDPKPAVEASSLAAATAADEVSGN